MKKIVMVILSIMLILLTSCGTAASEASEKAISAGKAAISIGNDYLGHKLTADEAQKKLMTWRIRCHMPEMKRRLTAVPRQI